MQIVSGGQTGVDRAALDVAVALGIPYGGWCPKGGWAEDLEEPPGLLAAYPKLKPTKSSDPADRTKRNVEKADATLILTRRGIQSPGTAFTQRLAAAAGKPHLVVDVQDKEAESWARALVAGVPAGGALNVAGPRESNAPGIYDEAYNLLELILS